MYKAKFIKLNIIADHVRQINTPKSDHATYILHVNINNTHKTKLLIYINVNATTLTAFNTR